MASGERRVALVSGASRGIGAEIARQLAADHGFTVFAGARDTSKVAEAEGIVPIRLDITDAADVEACGERVAAGPGRIDVLVNNAGIAGEGGYSDRFEDSDLDEIRRTLETNVWGAWRLTQAMLPLLRRSDDPRVVNISSGMGQLSDMGGGSHSYRLSKAALNVLTRTLAADGEVKVNSVCPGWVRTDMGGRVASRSVAEGADTAVWAATDPNVGSGGFYRDRNPIPW